MGRKKKGLHMNHLPHDHHAHNGHYDHDAYWNTNKLPPKTSGWNTGDAPQVCTNCSYLPDTKKGVIEIAYPVWRVLKALCDIKKIEWQALLSGRIEADDVVVIDGYYIPLQEVSSATVKNLDVIDDEFIAHHNIVAGVHSHGDMAVFFSGTDVEHTNMSLIKHNIVINNKRDYKAQSRVELPCGLVKFIESDLFITDEPNVEIIGIENIKKATPIGFLDKSQQGVTIFRKAGEQDKEPITDGLRWCPTCDTMPEEDAGTICNCHTKGLRERLPEFTREFYCRMNGKSYDLKYPHYLKFEGMSGNDY